MGNGEMGNIKELIWMPYFLAEQRETQLNLIVTINNIIYFNFCIFFMLVSKLFPQIKLFYRSLALPSYATASSNSPIFSKILQTRSLTDLVNLQKENSSEFNSQIFASTSKHINSLISARERIKFTEADELIDNLESYDVSSLNQRNLVAVLSVLRHLKTKGFSSNKLYKLKDILVKQYNELIKDREASESDIPEYINAYFEITSLRGNNSSECKFIIQKLLRSLEKGLDKSDRNDKGRINISDSQIAFLFYAFSCKSELTANEIRIRSMLLRKVGADLDSVRIHELIKIAVNINRSDIFDFQTYEFSIMGKMTEKILNSISDLEERSIYDLIRPENVGKMPGFYKIYEEIHRNIFNEISETGDTDLSYDSTFRIISYLSDKIQLKDTNETEQRKFFALLNKYAHLCSEENNKLLSIKLYDLVKNNYFSNDHKSKVISILKENNSHLNTNLLYELAVKGYDVTPFTKVIETYEIESQRVEVLVKLAAIVSQMAKGGAAAEVNVKFQAIENKIADHFSTPEKFMEFYLIARSDRSDSLSLVFFHENFSRFFEKLPNPYETESESSKYKILYLQYAVDSFKGKDLNQFFIKHQADIKTEEFCNMISYYSKGDARDIEFKRNLIQQLNKRVYDVIESKNKKWIGNLIEFIGKHSRYVIGGKLDTNSFNSIFRMIHCLIGKLDILHQVEQLYFFFGVLERYINRNFHNYNIESSYRSLLKHAINVLDKIFEKKHHLFTTVVHEGIRLNMITPKSLEKIPLDKINVPFYERARLEYIKNNTYTPKIEKLTPSTLPLLFTNHNLEKYLAENETKVIDIINKLSSKEVTDHLSIFNHSKTPTCKRIYAALLNQFISKAKYLDRHNIVGMFQNAYDNNYYQYYQYKKITEDLIVQFKARMSSYEFESHLELIKFIVTQPGLNPTDYYDKLVEYAFNQKEISNSLYEQLLLRLSNTNYTFKPSEAKEVTNIIKKNPHTGIFYFLMVENTLEPDFRKETVKQFVQKFNEKNEKEKKETFNKFYYQYLKKVYPEETADFNLPEESLYFEKFSTKPKDTESLNTIIDISGGKFEQLSGFGDNYILKIKNFALNIVYTKRLGSYHEHEFIKRAIPVVTGENLTVQGVFLNNNNLSNILEYVNKNCPGLFEKDLYETAHSAALKNKKQGRSQSEI